MKGGFDWSPCSTCCCTRGLTLTLALALIQPPSRLCQVVPAAAAPPSHRAAAPSGRRPGRRGEEAALARADKCFLDDDEDDEDDPVSSDESMAESEDDVSDGEVGAVGPRHRVVLDKRGRMLSYNQQYTFLRISI